jgi:fumarate reductase subunit C
MPVRLYLLQRLSALVMAPLVVVHLVVIIIAVRSGLDAESLLSRTRGSLVWALVYGSFVIAVSVHAAIGIRTVLSEWLRIRGILLEAAMWSMGCGLLALGLRAVYAVTVP